MNLYRLFLIMMALGLGLVMFAGGASADTGTAAGTSLTNRATVGWLVSGSLVDSPTAPSTDTTVGKISSDTLSAPIDQSANVGETKVFTYTYYNTSNRATTYNISVDSWSLNSGAVGWHFTLFINTGAPTSAVRDTKITLSLAAEAEATCSVAIWTHSTPANSPNGSYADFRLVIVPSDTADADTTNQYVGDNGRTYAQGSAGSADVARTSVAAAIMALSKRISALTLNGGNLNAPLPGATIVYELTYHNIGSATADSVIIRDTVPTNTTFDTMASTGGALGSSAAYAIDSGSTGWTAQMTSVAVPNNALYSLDWVNAHDWDPLALTPASIRHVRWIRQGVAAAQTATLRFRVIIN